MAGQPYATPLMSHIMSTPIPSSSRSGSIALSLSGTSSTPEQHRDFVVDRGVHLSHAQADISYESLVPHSIDFVDAPPLMGYSTMGNGYAGSEFIPGRPVLYGQPIAEAPDRFGHPVAAATPYHFTQLKVPSQYLAQGQGGFQYTDDAITDLAAVWCDIEEPPAPSSTPPTTVVPLNIAGEPGQSWAEHERMQGASMPRTAMAPPGTAVEGAPPVYYFVNQYQNGPGPLKVQPPQEPPQTHLEVPRLAPSAHGSPMPQSLLFDPPLKQPGTRPDHSPSPAIPHVMVPRTQGGDMLGHGLLPSPVDHAFPSNRSLRHGQGTVASPQPRHTSFEANSPSNLVPRHLSNSFFPLSPTGTQLPQWAQDRSFSSSSQQAPIMPSMSLSPGQLLGDDWEDSGKGGSAVALGGPELAANIIHPNQRRVVSGFQQPPA